MTKVLSLAVTLACAWIAAASALAGGSGGVTGAAFYVVGTPTDLSGTGAPDHSFDTIYELGGAQPNVATAAPGDQGYNGGRWRVRVLAFPSGYAAAVASADTNASGDIDSATELQTAFAAGTAVVSGSGPSFVCPVIPMPRSRT